jgi:hypothetical protein
MLGSESHFARQAGDTILGTERRKRLHLASTEDLLAAMRQGETGAVVMGTYWSDTPSLALEARKVGAGQELTGGVMLSVVQRAWTCDEGPNNSVLLDATQLP